MPFLRSTTRFQMSSRRLAPLSSMHFLKLVAVLFLFTACAWPQAVQLTTAEQVLDRYKQALGGQQAIANVQSMTVQGEVVSTSTPGKATFVYYAKPFKTLFKLTRADGTQIIAGFDGRVSWTITSKGAEIDKDTPSTRSAAMPTSSTRCTSLIISKSSNSPASAILKAIAATGCTARPTGEKTTTSSMMSGPACLLAIASSLTTRRRRLPLPFLRTTGIWVAP